MDESIEINGVTYVKKGSARTGCRAVVIVDRGWIFAGTTSHRGRT